MKIGYPGMDEAKIIKRYYKDGNKLVIEFLDNSKKSVISTPYTEKLILRAMLNQAKERDKKATRENIEEININNYHALCLSTLYTALLAGICITTENKSKTFKEFMVLVTCLVTGVTAYNLYDVYKDSKRENEIRKFKLLLEMYEELEKENSNFKDSIDSSNIPDGLSIGNVDNYSFKRVLDIKNKFSKRNNN